MTSDEKTRTRLRLEHAVAPDALRELVAVAVQEALTREFETFLGAAPYTPTAIASCSARGRAPPRAARAGPTSSTTSRSAGCTGVTYVVSVEHRGLVESGRYFPDAVHQRCQVHDQRNALSHVSNDTLQRELLRGLTDAWAASTADEAQRRLATLAATPRPRSPQAGGLARRHQWGDARRLRQSTDIRNSPRFWSDPCRWDRSVAPT